MTTRTFNQELQGYGADPVTAVASIDGVQVFSGEVNTVNQPLPTLPDVDNSYGVPTFEWNKDIGFAGPVTLTLQHTGESGVLMTTDTLANWGKSFPIDPATGNMYVTTSGADTFVSCYFFDMTDDQGTYTCADPMTSVTIDGTDVKVPSTRQYSGQKYYFLMPGQIMTAVITCDAGYANVNPPPGQ